MLLETLTLLGFLISLYTLIEYQRLQQGSTPLCDLSETVNCSKALTSDDASLFGLPNALIGLGYYPLLYAVHLYSPVIAFFLTLIAFIISIYLAYILYNEKIYCLVCLSTYVINTLLLILLLPMI